METGFTTPLPEECKGFIAKCFAGKQEEMTSFLEKMAVLQQYLYETNEKFNLTALPPSAFWSKHVADSLSLVLALPQIGEKALSLLDLGCGAGFPSLVLASAFPCLKVFSVDSTNKKISFVNSAAEKLSLRNLIGIHARGNELARKDPYKCNMDIVTARAVASADILVKESFAFLKNDGKSLLAVYRTSTQLEEEKEFLNRNKKFSWEATSLFSLPEEAGTRQFLFIRR